MSGYSTLLLANLREGSLLTTLSIYLLGLVGVLLRLRRLGCLLALVKATHPHLLASHHYSLQTKCGLEAARVLKLYESEVFIGACHSVLYYVGGEDSSEDLEELSQLFVVRVVGDALYEQSLLDVHLRHTSLLSLA